MYTASETGVLSIDTKSQKQRDETGANKLIDKMLKSKPAILTVGDNLDFSWIKENLNKNPINNLEKYHPDIIINNRDGDNMSTILMFCNDEGAVIATDSRVTICGHHDDNKIKIWKNDHTIIGQIGLYGTLNDARTKYIDLTQPVIRSFLAGERLENCFIQVIDNKKIYQYVDDDSCMFFCYAKDSGVAEIFCINKDRKYIYKSKEFIQRFNIFALVPPELNDIYKNLEKLYDGTPTNNLEVKAQRMKSIIKALIAVDNERPKLNLGISTIGGEVQCEIIKFNKLI